MDTIGSLCSVCLALVNRLDAMESMGDQRRHVQRMVQLIYSTLNELCEGGALSPTLRSSIHALEEPLDKLNELVGDIGSMGWWARFLNAETMSQQVKDVMAQVMHHFQHLTGALSADVKLSTDTQFACLNRDLNDSLNSMAQQSSRLLVIMKEMVSDNMDRIDGRMHSMGRTMASLSHMLRCVLDDFKPQGLMLNMDQEARSVLSLVCRDESKKHPDESDYLMMQIAVALSLEDAVARRSAPGDDPPPEFVCPISRDVMVDPVILVDTGKTYDRLNIQEWLTRHRADPTCPLTREHLSRPVRLVPNDNLRSAIETWRQGTFRAIRGPTWVAPPTWARLSSPNSSSSSPGSAASSRPSTSQHLHLSPKSPLDAPADTVVHITPSILADTSSSKPAPATECHNMCYGKHGQAKRLLVRLVLAALVAAACIAVIVLAVKLSTSNHSKSSPSAAAGEPALSPGAMFAPPTALPPPSKQQQVRSPPPPPLPSQAAQSPVPVPSPMPPPSTPQPVGASSSSPLPKPPMPPPPSPAQVPPPPPAASNGAPPAASPSFLGVQDIKEGLAFVLMSASTAAGNGLCVYYNSTWPEPFQEADCVTSKWDKPYQFTALNVSAGVNGTFSMRFHGSNQPQCLMADPNGDIVWSNVFCDPWTLAPVGSSQPQQFQLSQGGVGLWCTTYTCRTYSDPDSFWLRPA